MKPVPPIAPAAGAGERPLWSVMIPVYQPGEQYLRETLAGVLAQAPGPDRMQVAIIEDGSRDGVAAKVAADAGGRVEYHPGGARLGMPGNWNRAVGLARGHWVHLLHQDDLVLPGFYDALEKAAAARGDLGAAYVQHYLIDGAGRRQCLMSENPATQPGVVQDWIQHVFVHLSFQTPAVVVKREVYECLGGFRDDLPYALDWDMWNRIAASYPIWYDPKPLACYRRHAASASTGFFSGGANWRAVRQCIAISKNYLSHEAADVERRALQQYAASAVDAGLNALFSERRPGGAWSHFREARRFPVEQGFWRLLTERSRVGIARWRRDRGRSFPDY